MQKTEEIDVHQKQSAASGRAGILVRLFSSNVEQPGMPALLGTLNHAGVLSVTDPSRYSKCQILTTNAEAPGPDDRDEGSQAEVNAAARELSRKCDAYADDPLRGFNRSTASFCLQEPRLGKYSEPHAAFLFDQDDVSCKRHAAIRAKNDVSFKQALLRPRPVDRHALVVCFRNPQHFYNNVFIVGVDLKPAFLVRGYILIFFHSVFPDLNHKRFHWAKAKPNSLEWLRFRRESDI